MMLAKIRRFMLTFESETVAVILSAGPDLALWPVDE